MLFNLNGHGNKQTHIPFQLKLKCLSVVATRRTLLQHTPPHLPAGGLGFPWNPNPTLLLFGPLLSVPKTIHKMPFQKFNNQQRALPSSSSWPSSDLHNIISKHSLWSQPRPPTTGHRCPPLIQMQTFARFRFSTGHKIYIYLTAAQVPRISLQPPIYKHKFIQRN